jgi:uncharacterized protein (TIGR03437 family)
MLGGAGVSRWTPLNVKLLLPPRQSRGASLFRLAKPKARLVATIGGQPAEIVYAGAAPGFVSGYLQVNLRVPSTLKPGDAILITLDAENADPYSTHVGVTIALK